MAENPVYSEVFSMYHTYGIQLTESAYQKLCIYADKLSAEKTRQNVTAIQSKPEIWTRHFLDSAYLLQFIPPAGSVIDIGTGGGLPGIPLSILNPELQFTLLDSELQKIRFCEEIADLLQLNIRTIAGRAEEIARTDERAQYDAAVSRAMASAPVITELSLPFLKVGGIFLAMKGKNYDRNAESCAHAAESVGGSPPEILPYSIEHEDKNLILIRKICETPAEYPRRFAKIKRNPL